MTSSSLYKNRPFLALWLAQILTQVGTNMLSFVLALRVFKLTESNTAVGVLMLMVGVATLFFGASAGVLVDRWEKKSVLIAVNFLRFLLLALFIFTSESPLLIIILAFIFTVITQFFVPAEGAIIPNLVRESDLLRANSLFTFTLYASIICGFVGSGPALKFFGIDNVFIFISFFFLLSTFLVTFLPPRLGLLENIVSNIKKIFIGPRTEGFFSGSGFLFFDNSQILNWKEFFRELREGISFIRTKKPVFQAIIIMAFTQVIVAILLVIAPGFAVQFLGIEIEDASLVIMLPAALGMIIASLLLSHYGSRFSRKSMRTNGLLAVAASLLLIFLVQRLGFFVLPLVIFFLFALGIGNALINVPAQTILQEETEAKMRGRVYGVLSSLISVGSSLPAVLAGLLADIFGVGGVILSLSAVVFLVFYLCRRSEGRNYLNS